ncbi:MAG: hypothetical protein AAFQ54_14240 [Pseudomonadota bacterium]
MMIQNTLVAAAAIAASVGMPACCTTLDVLDFTAQVRGKALLLEARAGEALTTLVFYADGSASAQSGAGVWEGIWRGAGTELCYSFDAGPRAGSTCVEVAGRADGQYAASNGDVMRPVASAMRF